MSHFTKRCFFLSIPFILLLLYSATQASLWNDETYILDSTLSYSSFFEYFKETIKFETNPLLYNSLIYFLQNILNFKYTDLFFRLISITFSLIGVFFATQFAKEKYGESSALIMLGLLLCNVSFLIYSLQIRSYALLFLFGTWFWIEVSKISPRNRILSLITLLLTLTHFGGFFMALPVGLYFLIRGENQLKKSGKVILFSCLPSVSQIFYLLFFQSKQFYPVQIYWFPQTGWDFPFLIFYHLFSAPVLWRNENINLLSLIIVPIFLVLGFYGFKSKEFDRTQKSLLILLLTSIVSIWAIGYFYKTYAIPRAFIHFLTPFCTAIALGLDRFKLRSLTIPMFSFMLLNLFWFQDWFSLSQFPNYRTVAKHIGKAGENIPVIIDYDYSKSILLKYLNTHNVIFLQNDFLDKKPPNQYWLLGANSYFPEQRCSFAKKRGGIKTYYYNWYLRLYLVSGCD